MISQVSRRPGMVKGSRCLDMNSLLSTHTARGALRGCSFLHRSTTSDDVVDGTNHWTTILNATSLKIRSVVFMKDSIDEAIMIYYCTLHILFVTESSSCLINRATRQPRQASRIGPHQTNSGLVALLGSLTRNRAKGRCLLSVPGQTRGPKASWLLVK